MEFVIPFTKDELLKERSGRYYVKELTPVRSVNAALDATRTSLQHDGSNFILKHFDDFFSVLIHGDKLDYALRVRAFDRIAKSLEFLIADMEKKFPTAESQDQSRCVNKMHVYILGSLMCYLEDTTFGIEPNVVESGKKKKNAKKAEVREEWEIRRNKVLLSVHRWLLLPLQNLWSPPAVEDPFVQSIADFCYKILENDKENKTNSEVRDTICQILGVLVKPPYSHNTACTIKIIQLVKMHEALGPYLAAGIVSMVKSNGCPGFISELAREIEQTSLDDTSARYVSSFLEAIATIKPELVLPILDKITDYLTNDCYSMRNCAINVLGVVIKNALTGVNLTNEQKIKRSNCFDLLETYTRDINSYVRSKVFQVFQKLCCEGAVPMQRYTSLMKITVLHLREKSATVRKQALVLLRTLLESHPFNIYIDRREIQKRKEEMTAKYEKIQSDIVAASGSGHNERMELWKTLSPGLISAIKEYIADENDEESSEDEEEEDDQDDTETYEEIRDLIIQKKFRASVKRIVKISRDEDCTVDSLDDSDKEQSYLYMLLFIFMESAKEGSDNQESTANSREQMKQIMKMRKSLGFLHSAEVFASTIENALNQVELMLFSPTVTVAVEACTLLATALRLKIPGASVGIQKALSHVFSREESIRNNVAQIYRDIYLVYDGRKVATSFAVKGLIGLFKGLKPSQSPALAHLISIWIENKDLNDEHLLMLLQTFAMKTPGTTVEDSRSAILLLAMAAQTRPSIIIKNVDNIVEVGLKIQENQDLLLARDSCRALLTIKIDNPSDSPIRFVNDHKLFDNLVKLLKNHFAGDDIDTYVSFAHDAVNVIYHLANQPEKLIEDLLSGFNDHMKEPEVDSSCLAKLLYFVGHAAMKHMAHLDTSVYKESKRRNAILEAKKGRKQMLRASNVSVVSSLSMSSHSSARKARRSIFRKKDADASTTEDVGEDVLGGATADDADAEAIETELECHIIKGEGLFSLFSPLVIDVCQYPEKYKNPYVQAFGVQGLTKMMSISAEFCQQNLQLLITILERSTLPEIRGNILIGLADLMTRFPNEVEPWTAHLYGRLRDKEVSVRKTAVRVLASLVKREMIRAKGQMSEMALCIVDEDESIRLETKQFFEELSRKGNVLYNILPDILSTLTSADVDVKEDDLHLIVKHVLGLLSKEKESDALLDKICQRLKMATTDRQCRDLAYCLSLLQLGKKGIGRLTTNLPLIRNKLHIREVQKALKDIIEGAKKKSENKEICTHLENEIEKLSNDDEERDKDNDKDKEAMPPPMAPPMKTASKKQKQKSKRNKDHDDSDEEEDDQDENAFQNESIRRSSRSKVVKTVKRKTDDLSPDQQAEDQKPKRRSNASSSKSTANNDLNGSGTLRRSVRKSRDQSFTENTPTKRAKSSRK